MKAGILALAVMIWSFRGVKWELACPRIYPTGRKVIILSLLNFLPGCSMDVKTSEINDLLNIERLHSPNDALACPLRLCRAEADFESPIFRTSKGELINEVSRLVIAEPRTKLAGSNRILEQLVFIQRSRFLGFPDTVWIQGVSVNRGSSLIIYSRSNHGYWDLGVNRSRIRSWLVKIEKAVKK